MEIIFLAPLIVWYFLFHKRDSKSSFKSPITKIDDLHYIVNNEFVCLDKNSDTNIMRQEMEDSRHYNYYETNRLSNMVNRFEDMYIHTKGAIHRNPEFLESVTYHDVIEYYDKYYYDYCKVIDKINSKTVFSMYSSTKLSINEYIVCKKHPIECGALLGCLLMRKIIGAYHIHSPDNAKYMDGDMDKLMENEFEEKWL